MHMCLAFMILQADFLEPHLHGIVAFFNFMLIRLDFFENSAKGKLVRFLFIYFFWCSSRCLYLCC